MLPPTLKMRSSARVNPHLASGIHQRRMRYAMNHLMVRRSPTVEGYKAVFAQPFLLFAEISWRWTLGCCGIVLLLLTSAEYLNTIPVTDTDVLLLNSGQRFLIVRGLLHAFQGSGGRFIAALIIVIAALAIAWV